MAMKDLPSQEPLAALSAARAKGRFCRRARRSAIAALSALVLVRSGGGAASASPEAETKTEAAANAPAEGSAKDAGAGEGTSETKANDAPPPADEPVWEREPSTRRDGLIFGLQGNLGLAMASGYPLDLKKIGRAAHYTETDIGFSAIGLLWVGVALKDWLSFGVGATLDGLVAGDEKLGWGYGGVFRLEGFPLWPLGGIGKEIGVTFDAGASAFAVPKPDSNAVKLIDGGAASYLGGGVFYEGIRYWRISMGPGIYAGYMWSDTVRHGAVTLDFRATFYSHAAEPEQKKAVARRQ